MKNTTNRCFWFILDLYNGLIKYKIPFCCVIEYSIGMFKVNKNQEERKSWNKNQQKSYFMYKNKIDKGYIPCDKCFGG